MIFLVYSKLKRWLRVRTYFQQKHHAHIHLHVLLHGKIAFCYCYCCLLFWGFFFVHVENFKNLFGA